MDCERNERGGCSRRVREGNRQQVSGGELKDHPGPSNHAPQGSTSSSSTVNERSHLPAPCLSLSCSLFLSLAHTQTPPRAASAISAPLHEINWPPTKDSKSHITSGEKSAFAIIVTECVENQFKYVIPKHGLSLRGLLNCQIFINNYELIEENIWFIYVSVI